MANLKELRTRITSVKSTMQITSAMKMVSAAKLKRAQDAIVQMRPYANKLKELLENLSASLENSTEGKYSEQREVEKVLIVAISSNRGLCGGFNANINKKVNRLVSEDLAGKDVTLYTIGKRVSDFYESRDFKIMNSNTSIFDNLDFEHSAAIAQEIMDAFVAGDYDHVVLVYNQFKNAAVQIVQTEQFLPVKPIESDGSVQLDYIFEPGKEEIVLEMIPKSLKTQIYKALLDSHASEHGARMTAMHKATDNAGELRDSLSLVYNRQRQAAITNEILEIVSGASAQG